MMVSVLIVPGCNNSCQVKSTSFQLKERWEKKLRFVYFLCFIGGLHVCCLNSYCQSGFGIYFLRGRYWEEAGETLADGVVAHAAQASMETPSHHM